MWFDWYPLYRSIGRNRWHTRFFYRFILIFTDFIDFISEDTSVHLFIKKWKLTSCKQQIYWELSWNWDSKDQTFITVLFIKHYHFQINLFSSKLGLKSSVMADIGQAPVVQKVDNAIHRINHYPLEAQWFIRWITLSNVWTTGCRFIGG